MVVTQVPAKTSHWGLFNFPYGVPGRLGFSPTFIVIHWMDGTLASTDLVFTGKTNPERMVSSHFGVEDENIHQYVLIGNTAWHAGMWIPNLQSVGIEHSAQPGRDASDATYDSSGQLIAQLWKQCPTIPPTRASLVPHKSIIATACPGTIDLDRLFSIATGYYNQGVNITVTSATIVPVQFQITVDSPLGSAYFREEPTTSAQQEGLYPNGRTFMCDATVTGESVTVTSTSGRTVTTTKWYRSVPDQFGKQYFISAAVSIHN